MIDIVMTKSVPIDIVAERLGLDVKQRRTRCISATHRDTNPSLSFDLRTNKFKCFGCDLSGDVFDLVKIVMGFDFRTAADWLESDRGLPTVALRPISNAPRPGDSALLGRFWSHCSVEGDWLAHKGLDASKYGVRAVTREANRIIPSLPVGGLFIPYYQNGELTWGRWRNTRKTGLRFLNVPGVDTIIYNQDALPRDGCPLYLAEGETDTMSLTEMGHAAIGFPGASQFKLLAMLARWVEVMAIPAIVTAFDNDAAGAQLHDKVVALNLGVPISRFDLKGYKDVNDLWLDNLS